MDNFLYPFNKRYIEDFEEYRKQQKQYKTFVLWSGEISGGANK